MKYLFGLFVVVFILFIATYKVLPIKALGNDLFISEYVEGISSNKALEIYNPTMFPINLNNYKLLNYVNGNMVNTYTLLFTVDTILNPGQVYVVCNSASNSVLLAKCNQTAGGVLNFNGNDAIALVKADGTAVDVFGQIGFDPGTEWGYGLESTMDNTLIRKSSVSMGNINGSAVFDPTIEWLGFESDYFDNLGIHIVNTPTPSVTAVPTESASPVPDPTATYTSTPTSNPTDSPFPTNTPTPTSEPTSSPTPTEMPTISPLPTPTPTQSPSMTPEPTVTNFPEPSPTYTPSPLATPTSIPTTTPETTPTSYPTLAPTPTPVPSLTPTFSPRPLSEFKNFGQWISQIAKECGRLVKFYVHLRNPIIFLSNSIR